MSISFMKQSIRCLLNVKHHSKQIVSVNRERIPRLNVLHRATIVNRNTYTAQDRGSHFVGTGH